MQTLLKWVLAVVILGLGVAVAVLRLSGQDAVELTKPPVPPSSQSGDATLDPRTPGESAADTSTIVLGRNGLQIVNFGDTPERTLSVLRTALGDPDHDTGWVEPAQSSQFGVCPGNRVRGIYFSSLLALFTDGETSHAPAGTEHLFTYFQTNLDYLGRATDPLAAMTAEGIRIGDTVSDLQAVYGKRLNSMTPRSSVSFSQSTSGMTAISVDRSTV